MLVGGLIEDLVQDDFDLRVKIAILCLIITSFVGLLLIKRTVVFEIAMMVVVIDAIQLGVHVHQVVQRSLEVQVLLQQLVLLQPDPTCSQRLQAIEFTGLVFELVEVVDENPFKEAAELQIQDPQVLLLKVIFVEVHLLKELPQLGHAFLPDHG